MSGRAPGGGKAAQGTPRRPATQEWLPVRDIVGGQLHLRDGSLVAGLELSAPSLALRSASERRRLVLGFFEALQLAARAEFQILTLPRPIDLDAYLDALRRMSREAQERDPRRARFLREYLGYVTRAVAGGEALERRSYLLLRVRPGPRGQAAADDLRRLAEETEAALRRAGIEARLLDDAGLAEAIFAFLHPAQAAFERFALEPATMLLEVSLAHEPAS